MRVRDEIQEGGAVWDASTIRGDAVTHSKHAVLTDTKAKVTIPWRRLLVVPTALDFRLV